MVGGGMSCIKYILAVFNFVFVIFGILLIVFGIQSLAEANDFRAVLESPDHLAIACVIVGVLLFIIAFLGCCGALKENQCMLLSFSVILIIILIVELIIAGLAFAFKDDVRGVVNDRFNSTLSNYDFNNPNATVTEMFDKIQENMHCCGINNFTDYERLFPEQSGNLPESCCGKTPDNLSIDSRGAVARCNENNDNLYKDGCLDKFVANAMKIYGPIGLIAITVAILQLLGVIFACCLTYAVKREYQVV